jgi:aspartyl-tRNA(Asn)/glutamyl-tRNA(Gln) amidotransferase subunit C
MKINKREIEHIAMLARLSLSEEEKDLFGSQLGGILDYMEQLNGLDTKGIEPTSHVLSIQNVMREDIPAASLTRTEALMNAPSRTEQFFRVPKIIE